MSEVFADYGQLIVFLHVLSAFVWVGGMIAIRIAVHPVISGGGVSAEQKLQSDVMELMLQPKQRLGITLQIMGKLFNLVMVFIILLFATGLVMAIATGGHHGALKSLFLSKEFIWTIMAVNYSYMYIKRAKAWKLFSKGDVMEAKAQLKFIPNLLLPLNIVLGIIALWLGVSLRGL
ncbi:MAG TPA: hypothetical protein PLH07_04365 [Sulfurovum sp.]|jgi:uncharacterized membrane protein|nr:MAG: hypothetical protein B7Y63_02440 [Sulfurovum sp. 35-42-20]OYY57406.1 MAG: hypothetical protein B7Y52_01210 [Sulfurovum sp. 28-43-6]OYZ49460.1 MAG: hypothetical protein B7Y13_04625 [Sulfurovum sp. 24-42-9]OZA59938.1 MAG: hypothetical protein B7X69_06045 [Sulfurovum sp. 39-42-12]HQR73651.1 hypothetical protein [Sulfurovum sp.]